MKWRLRFKLPTSVEICRNHQLCKICARCVDFPGKQRNFSHNLHTTTRFTHTKCDFALKHYPVLLTFSQYPPSLLYIIIYCLPWLLMVWEGTSESHQGSQKNIQKSSEVFAKSSKNYCWQQAILRIVCFRESIGRQVIAGVGKSSL